VRTNPSPKRGRIGAVLGGTRLALRSSGSVNARRRLSACSRPRQKNFGICALAFAKAADQARIQAGLGSQREAPDPQSLTPLHNRN
jgi:hypothetical protein